MKTDPTNDRESTDTGVVQACSLRFLTTLRSTGNPYFTQSWVVCDYTNLKSDTYNRLFVDSLTNIQTLCFLFFSTFLLYMRYNREADQEFNILKTEKKGVTITLKGQGHGGPLQRAVTRTYSF